MGSATKTPLLGSYEKEEKRWWEKIVDVGEAKSQVMFSIPMIITNVSYYSITLISVMFAGHLGELELAGSTLGNSWATVTGLALMLMSVQPEVSYDETIWVPNGLLTRP